MAALATSNRAPSMRGSNTQNTRPHGVRVASPPRTLRVDCRLAGGPQDTAPPRALRDVSRGTSRSADTVRCVLARAPLSRGGGAWIRKQHHLDSGRPRLGPGAGAGARILERCHRHPRGRAGGCTGLLGRLLVSAGQPGDPRGRFGRQMSRGRAMSVRGPDVRLGLLSQGRVLRRALARLGSTGRPRTHRLGLEAQVDGEHRLLEQARRVLGDDGVQQPEPLECPTVLGQLRGC